MRQVTKVIPSGHGLLEEAPEATFAVITAFMRELGTEERPGELVPC